MTKKVCFFKVVLSLFCFTVLPLQPEIYAEIAIVDDGIKTDACSDPRHCRACNHELRKFTVRQINDLCSSCHTKNVPLTDDFSPGERFFDHYDLITLEDTGFYPDGRELGEHFTGTAWRISPCVKSARLGCNHCHRSGGRFGFKSDPNQACAPCHIERIRNAETHSRHPPDSSGGWCISCHMPTTEYLQTGRTVHSMLPPTPSATIRFGSPNACNLCHTDKDANWADSFVRHWHQRDYQASVLFRAGLVEAARKQDWSRLSDMLAYIESPDRDAVFAASLLRLLSSCANPVIWPVARRKMTDPSPLIRCAAAELLSRSPPEGSVCMLIDAAGDDYRLVRVRAVASLIGYPQQVVEKPLKVIGRNNLEQAADELLTAQLIRPNHWTSHADPGTYYFNLGVLISGEDFGKAARLCLNAFEISPNPKYAYTLAFYMKMLGYPDHAAEMLRSIVMNWPLYADAYFLLGDIYEDQGNLEAAKSLYHKAIENDEISYSNRYQFRLRLDSLFKRKNILPAAARSPVQDHP